MVELSTTIPLVGIWKIYKDAKKPQKMTEEAACYDFFAYLKKDMVIVYYDGYNEKKSELIKEDGINIKPFCRYLIPTGCKFLIPKGNSLRIHPRSGNGLKRGLSIPNCEGIIDSDYPEQTYIILANYTFCETFIKHYDSLCQIELNNTLDFQFYDLDADFGQMTNRVSGLGSTGTVGAK